MIYAGMRPVYETEVDLIRERQIADEFTWKWGVEYVKLGKFSPVDFEGWRSEEVVHYLETKWRGGLSLNKWRTYAVSFAKMTNVLDICEATNRPAILAVKFVEGIYYTPISRKLFFVSDKGSSNYRGDERDIEPMAHFLISRFIPL